VLTIEGAWHYEIARGARKQTGAAIRQMRCINAAPDCLSIQARPGQHRHNGGDDETPAARINVYGDLRRDAPIANAGAYQKHIRHGPWVEQLSVSECSSDPLPMNPNPKCRQNCR